MIIFNQIMGLNIENPFVIGICSYNNSEWVKKNLDSVFNQSYQNYRVIYIDDASSDGTADIVEAYVKECGQEHRFTLIGNSKRHRAMANHYQIIHACRDEEIIVSLDGDDWFAHTKVLQKINYTYLKKKNWLVYSQFKRWPNGRSGYSHRIPARVIKENDFRRYEWVTGQTRTYYAWLAKSIKLKDLLMNQETHETYGKFFPSSCDVAMMFPMLEMVKNHFDFIHEPLYIYNMHDFNDRSLNSDLQGFCNWCIRQLPVYKPLKKPRLTKLNPAKADVVVFNEKSQEIDTNQLVKGSSSINNIFTLTDSSINSFNAFIEADSDADYVLFLLEPDDITTSIKLAKGLGLLEQTRAYAWYPDSPLIDLIKSAEYFTKNGKNIYFWLFGTSDIHPHKVKALLIKKKKVRRRIDGMHFTTIDQFKKFWFRVEVDQREIGLLEGTTSTTFS